MSKEKKKKNEHFGTFLEKEILTANRYITFGPFIRASFC